MMGDTYSNVSDNSAWEWKFYRIKLLNEINYTSLHPPPTNLILVPLQHLREYYRNKQLNVGEKVTELDSKESTSLITPAASLSYNSLRKFTRKMEADKRLSKTQLKNLKKARDEVIAEEIEAEEKSLETSVIGVHNRLRALASERVNDRSFAKKKFRETAKSMEDLQTQLKLLPQLVERIEKLTLALEAKAQ
jgi:hypothetical protein